MIAESLEGDITIEPDWLSPALLSTPWRLHIGYAYLSDTTLGEIPFRPMGGDQDPIRNSCGSSTSMNSESIAARKIPQIGHPPKPTAYRWIPVGSWSTGWPSLLP